jgi:hypothetical protein
MRNLIGLLATLVLALALATPALAAKPNNQACLGRDISTYAQEGRNYGAFVATLALTTDGVGDEIRAHLAGAIPDAVLPNSCNND